MIDVPTEEIQRARYELVARGYADITWVRPEGVSSDADQNEMSVEEFRKLWTADFEQPLARYCELMGVKVKPRIGSGRFHDPGKMYRDEMDRIKARVEKGLMTEQDAEEVMDLRRRIIWSSYCIMAGSAPDQEYDSEFGFLVGCPRSRDEVAWRQWSLRHRGVALADDFKPWMEVIRA